MHNGNVTAASSTSLTGLSGVRRMADRLGFGMARGESGALARLSPVDVGRRLVEQQVPDPSIVQLGPQPPVLIADGKPIPAAVDTVNKQTVALVDWWLDRMVATPAPFTEKMTWFWHGHFATGAEFVANPNLMARQNQTQRALGAGSFVDLAQTMTVDPAMLVWLNGDQNRLGAPNENLGRELMELFTLGIGRYTEADVREAARALTGWRVDGQAFGSTFVPEQFDPAPKTVLGVPVDDARSLVAMLTGRPVSAEFVVRRMWRRFVSAEAAPADAVARLVAALGPGRDVRAMMRALVVEPALLDPRSTLVKQPVEWLVGLMRALGVRPAALGPDVRQQVRNWLHVMGQIPFLAPNVGGWPDGAAWLTSGAASARSFLASLVVANADPSAIAAAAPARRPAAVAAVLGADRWSPRTLAALQAVASDPTAIVAVAACAPEYVVSR